MLLPFLFLLLSLPNLSSGSAQTSPPPASPRPRSLIEYARRDCTGDVTICTNISSGDCCVAGMSNVRPGRCRDCRSRDMYTPYTGGRCRNEECSTSGDTCVNVSGGVQTGQRWVKGDGDDGDSPKMGVGVERDGKGECANVVEPDLVSVSGRWFVVNGSMPVEDKEVLWEMRGTGVDREAQVLPEGLREFEVTGMEGVY